MGQPPAAPPAYAPPLGRPNAASSSSTRPRHTNAVILASDIRQIGEQQFQNLLQQAQYEAKIYNPEIEPEHETECELWGRFRSLPFDSVLLLISKFGLDACGCGPCRYRIAKLNRRDIHDAWSKAVKYPG